MEADPASGHEDLNRGLLRRGDPRGAHSGLGATIDRQFRDSRVDDPVATDNNQRVGNLITIGDLDGGAVLDFESSCDMNGCTYGFDGELAFPGAVYLVDTANVN